MRTKLLPILLLWGCAADVDVPAQTTTPVAPEKALEPAVERSVLSALAAPRSDLRIMASETDELGITHVRVRQLVKNVPVWEGEAIVHIAPDGTTEVTDARETSIAIDASPTVTAARAEELALAKCAACSPLASTDLWFVRDGSRVRLAWRVQLSGHEGPREVMPIVFVDAHDGSVFRAWDNVQSATGHTQYNGTRTIPSAYKNGLYYLEDAEYNIGIYDLKSGDDPDDDPFSRLVSSDTVWTRADAAQAMFSIRNVAEYFWGTHGRWLPDGQGGPGKVNAIDGSGTDRLGVFIDATFWSESRQAYYGANATWTGVLKLGKGGDGWSDATSLDIVAHEFTHGVVQYTAGLVYMNESGALNESFADVFGAMAERYRLGESANTWRLGEDVVGGDGLRRLDAPSIDHYTKLRIGTEDNGYVHSNSGIGNKAFHLVAAGGTHPEGGTMRGIGADAAAKIWYRALTTYMTSGTSYIQARGATQNAARDLFGYHSPEWNAVSNAWAIVGLGIVSNDVFANGGFEGDAGWSLSGRAFISDAYPRSGSTNLTLGNANYASGSASQDFSIDPFAQTATLSFYVNVTSSEFQQTALDKLYVDVIDADTGALISRLGTWSNLDKSSYGSYTYHGAYNFTSLRGRTVRVKVSATTDGYNPTTFRVDDMKLTIVR